MREKQQKMRNARPPKPASRLAAILALFVLSACADAQPPPTAEAPPADPEAAAGVDGSIAQFAFTSPQFRDEFNRRAAADHTDRIRIADCVEVHWVMGCGFEMAAFRRAAPSEAAAAAAQSAGQMPDEQFDIVGLGGGNVSAIDFSGNGSTPARRTHYVGQMKTLLRVLSPGIDASDVERIIDSLQLRARPARREGSTRVARPFAIISCSQGPDAGAFINCTIEPPAK
jgi:hypothetical protein